MKWQRVRESNPFSTFRDVAQFRHKYALGCVSCNRLLGRDCAYCASKRSFLSEIVRKDCGPRGSHFTHLTTDDKHAMRRLPDVTGA